MIERVKQIDVKTIIEKETGKKFNKNNFLNECPLPSCNSGKGPNKSSAFSVNTKDNYFHCFSCGVGGTGIDFMMHLKKGWKERNAIKYLAKEYLNIEFTSKNETSELSKFEKTVFAIKENPLQKATRYLVSRKIKTKSLPKGSYYYDSWHKAVAFFDSEEKFINRRIIEPVNGSPKSWNKNGLKNCIYDKQFKPEFDTVFVHEGVINVLSIPSYSGIAIFSSSNKFTDKKKLEKYIDDKKVVLAFDNDTSGNRCFEYYKNLLISNRYNLHSILKLKLPKGKDANDLLISGELDNFLKNKSSYELIWENVMTKPIPTDSEDKDKDNQKYFFYKENSCYYTKDISKGKSVAKKSYPTL